MHMVQMHMTKIISSKISFKFRRSTYTYDMIIIIYDQKLLFNVVEFELRIYIIIIAEYRNSYSNRDSYAYILL